MPVIFGSVKNGTTKATLNLFIDISNWYGATVSGIPQYTFQRTADNKAFLTANGSNAIPPDFVQYRSARNTNI